MRFYIHGDQNEGNQNTYYCSVCDTFAESDHFRLPCFGKKHIDAYGYSSSNFEDVKKKGTAYTRPDNPKNIFNY